jgi:serine/threonine protein phosphatase PrpC
MDKAENLKGGGWTLGIGTSVRFSGQASPDFHAVYNGDDLGSPSKGVVAAIATSDGAWEAAQITVNGFAEGYFGSGETLSAGRAAAKSLTSINSWLYQQSKDAPAGREMTASLSAVLFSGRRIDIVHVGDCRVYVSRNGQLTPLTTEHLRGQEKNGPTRLIGVDGSLHIDHFEHEAEAGDRFVLLSVGAAARVNAIPLAAIMAEKRTPQEIATRIGEELIQFTEIQAASVLVVDVIEPARRTYEDIAAHFADLPLRKAPRDGDLWDGFRIGRTINRGRYTLLKRAWDEIENHDVVLKIPLASMLADQIFRAGFLREAWIGAAIKISCVASYITLPPGRQTSLYLVMPFYRGETLEKRLARSPRISLAEGIGIALKLCAAVTELGRHDVIHRDIKPENIMLPNSGDVLLLDLGLAYLTGIDDAEEDSLSGTTRYMAPELFSGTPANARSEVFSLGVTIYRMFSGGKFPFGQRERQPLSRLRPDLPAWLGAALKRAMATVPSERFSAADGFGQALEHGLVRGDMRASGSLRRYISPLRVWQMLTLILAAATSFLLITGWRP